MFQSVSQSDASQGAAPPLTNDLRSLQTRARLLDVAGECFGRVGFAGATIRSISTRAGVNLAAVHYHFGDKAGLYASVLRHAREQCCPVEEMRAAAQANDMHTPEERLGFFVRSMLTRVLDKGRPNWHTQLWLREMVSPTHELDRVVREQIRPLWDSLRGIVSELLERPLDDEQVWLGTCSVVSQVLLYKHGGEVLTRLYAEGPVERLSPNRPLGDAEIDALAMHITRFSIGGLRGLVTGRGDTPC